MFRRGSGCTWSSFGADRADDDDGRNSSLLGLRKIYRLRSVAESDRPGGFTRNAMGRFDEPSSYQRLQSMALRDYGKDVKIAASHGRHKTSKLVLIGMNPLTGSPLIPMALPIVTERQEFVT